MTPNKIPKTITFEKWFTNKLADAAGVISNPTTNITPTICRVTTITIYSSTKSK